MHKAALQADDDPARLSYVHAVRVIRRKLPRGIKGKLSDYKMRASGAVPKACLAPAARIQTLK